LRSYTAGSAADQNAWISAIAASVPALKVSLERAAAPPTGIPHPAAATMVAKKVSVDRAVRIRRRARRAFWGIKDTLVQRAGRGAGSRFDELAGDSGT
jgi:hypothetical protein